MGGWGTITSGFKGTPKAPKPKAYTQDQYFSAEGKGTAHGRGADEAAYSLLQKYLGREPGYTADEQKAMYDQPADQMKLQEQAALRGLNQGAAGAGSFGAGATSAGRGGIIGGGIRARAGLKQNIMVQAAEVAMQDRMRQIQAAQDYSTGRLASTTANTQGQNAYNMGLNQLDFSKWQTQLAQYNFDRQKNREFVGKVVGAATAGVGGGGGMGGGGGGGGG